MTPDEATRQTLAEALLEAMTTPKAWRDTPGTEMADAILATEPGSRLTTTDHPDVRAGLALRAALVAFVDDPLRFATDPDGDCWLCGEPTDPEDHDEDNDCPVTVGRAALSADVRVGLAQMPTDRPWAIHRFRDGRFLVALYDPGYENAVDADLDSAIAAALSTTSEP
jgi:hypothetical protein